MTQVKKKLTKQPENGKIAGVCAGFADYFDVDVTLVRVIFVILAFATGGLVALLYLIFIVILPVEKDDTQLKTSAEQSVTEKFRSAGVRMQENNGAMQLRNYFAIALVVLGAWLLLVQFFPDVAAFRWGIVWPLLLVVAGIIIMTRKDEK